jgi:hypothetical protein
MKKFSLLFTIFLISCGATSVSNGTSPNLLTRVTLVDVSWRKQNASAVIPTISNIKQSAKSIEPLYAADIVYDRDVLIFTLELEDPNFEFIQLLSITFNNRLIRANVDNSITSTRDCGVNICIDFPFTIEKSILIYEVNEIKFSKSNVIEPVNVRIEDDSIAKVELNVYQDSVFLNVLEIVNFLNNKVQNFEYYSNPLSLSGNDASNLISMEGIKAKRTFYFTGFNWNNYIPPQPDYVWFPNGIPTSFGEQVFENPTELDFIYDSQGQHVGSNYVQLIMSENGGPGLGIPRPGPLLFFGLWDQKYQDAFFYNVENDLYLNVLGKTNLIISLTPSLMINFYVPETE